MPSLDDLKNGAKQFRAAVIEDVDVEKGEMLIKAVPYGVPTEIGADILEEFRPGAFARSAKSPDRLSLWSGHGGPLIGRGLEVEDRPDSLWFRAKLGRTQAAKDALLDYEDGIASDPSIEFRPMPDWMSVERRSRGYSVVHRRAHLLGVALVPNGAYAPHAFVDSVRDDRDRAAEDTLLWLAEFKRRAL